MFSDRLDALLALASTYARRASCREERAAYLCRRCRRWHLTSDSTDVPYGDALQLITADGTLVDRVEAHLTA